MKIGIMLRQVDDPGGIGMLTRNLMSELLRIDGHNEYVLAFRNESQLSVIDTRPNVTKHVVNAPGKLTWDQIAMPVFARRHRLDLLYNPKLTVPLFSPCSTVLGLIGAEQSVLPKLFRWYDRAYFSVANALYCKAASAIINAVPYCGR